MSTDEAKDCIVILCGGCRRVVYAAVNDPRVMDTAAIRSMGEIVRDGGIVEHMTAPQVRTSEFGCTCK